jgi:hypothetical protein
VLLATIVLSFEILMFKTWPAFNEFADEWDRQAAEI